MSVKGFKWQGELWRHVCEKHGRFNAFMLLDMLVKETMEIKLAAGI